MTDTATETDVEGGFGARLRKARTGAGLTQEAVVARLGDGFSAVSLYRWEHGRETPSISKVARLAELYGVAIDWLVGRTPFRTVFVPGKVVVNPQVLQLVAELVDRRGGLEDLPPNIVRPPGVDYAWRLPEEATLLDGAAAERIEQQMQELLGALRRRR